MLVKTNSSTILGVSAQLITIEVSVSRGIRYYIVGLPDTSVRESLQRIESAIGNSGFHMPRQKIVINLAPAYLRKEGSAFDLAIALGILAASGQMNPALLKDTLFLGELSLDGSLLPVRGVLPVALLARERGFKTLVVPEANAGEAALADDVAVYGMRGLAEVIRLLNTTSESRPKPCVIDRRPLAHPPVG